MALDILMAIVEIFGVFAVGWLARRLGYIREQDLQQWSGVVVDILLPLLVFEKVLRGFDPDRLGQLWPLPAIGLGMVVVGGVSGIFLRRGLRSGDRELARTFHHFCAINNYGFLPIIIIERLWDDGALANLFLLSLGSTVGLWTVGVAVLGDFDPARTLRKLVTPTLTAMALAVTLAMAGWADRVPEVALTVANKAGGAGVTLMLLLVGASLYPAPRLRDRRDLAYLSFVRLALLPLVFVTVLHVLPLSDDVRNVSVVVALMPASVSSTIMTRRYGGDPGFAAQAVIVTTVLAAGTAPASLWLLERLAR